MESQRKSRLQHHKNFPMKGNPLQSKYYCQKIQINPKVQECESQSGIEVGRLTIQVRSFEIKKL